MLSQCTEVHADTQCWCCADGLDHPADEICVMHKRMNVAMSTGA